MKKKDTTSLLEEFRQRLNEFALQLAISHGVTNKGAMQTHQTPSSSHSPIPPESVPSGNKSSTKKIPRAPQWDVSMLTLETEAFETTAANDIAKLESSNSGVGGIISWIKKLTRSSNDSNSNSKAMMIAESLLPTLQTTEAEMRLWLMAISERKELTIQHTTTMMGEMEVSIDLCDSYVDYYDEMINECLKISFEVTKEISDLRIAGSFNEEIVPLLAAAAALKNSALDDEDDDSSSSPHVKTLVHTWGTDDHDDHMVDFDNNDNDDDDDDDDIHTTPTGPRRGQRQGEAAMTLMDDHTFSSKSSDSDDDDEWREEHHDVIHVELVDQPASRKTGIAAAVAAAASTPTTSSSPPYAHHRPSPVISLPPLSLEGSTKSSDENGHHVTELSLYLVDADDGLESIPAPPPLRVPASKPG